jgi:sugar/nucleoside kinase (ribokinase family)
VINDILVETAGPLAPGQDNPASIQVRPGGSAANQAAWLGHLGLDVVFAGRAGAADAQAHRAELARFGVTPELAADDSAGTGSIVVLVGPDGERTMITDRGANLRLRAADVPARLLDGVRLLHLTGYSLFEPGPRAVALGLLAAARARGLPVSIDPGSAAFLAALGPGEFLAWTRGAAVCFPNWDEARVLARPGEAAGPTGAAGPGVAAEPPGSSVVRPDVIGPAAIGPEDAAAWLAGHYGIVALKLGAEGALLATAGGASQRFPARPAAVRDTTGAGDAFCAGFLAAWLGGRSPASAMEAGARVAAEAVAALGGRPQPSSLPAGAGPSPEVPSREGVGRGGAACGESRGACNQGR